MYRKMYTVETFLWLSLLFTSWLPNQAAQLVGQRVYSHPTPGR